MRKIAILLSALPSIAHACGGSSGPSYAELALFFVLFLVGLAAFILPISILSLNKLCSGKSILLLFIFVLVLTITAVVLIIYGNYQNQLKAIGTALLGFSLFLPYALLAFQTLLNHGKHKNI